MTRAMTASRRVQLQVDMGMSTAPLKLEDIQERNKKAAEEPSAAENANSRNVAQTME